MAANTNIELRQKMMYSLFVRNHTTEGTFAAVEKDLDRIRALGTDIIWFMPIQPTGVLNRKGRDGSPYAIKDYRKVDPALGTMEDFKHLTDEIHKRGMQCILDVVYNHTSPDSWLIENHPDWFKRDAQGNTVTLVPDWSDIADLDYGKEELWQYQIDTLKMWAEMVDGFRCDVAPLVPLDFWLRARAEVEAVRPGCFWLAESVEPDFVQGGRADGLPVLSDSECFQAFDACYDYDIFHDLHKYLRGEVPLSFYADRINRQEVIYPDNYVKLRFLENHDQARAAFVIPEGFALLNWTAFLYFQKGLTMLYAGQEAECGHRPSLFDKDDIAWNLNEGVTRLLQTLAKLKKNPLLTDSRYEVKALPRDILLAEHRKGGRRLTGLFSMGGQSSLVPVDAPDGLYPNLLDSACRPVEVYGGMVRLKGAPVVFEWSV